MQQINGLTQRLQSIRQLLILCSTFSTPSMRSLLQHVCVYFTAAMRYLGKSERCDTSLESRWRGRWHF